MFTLVAGINAKAQSDLLITPFRVVFENGKNIEELTVANTGKGHFQIYHQFFAI